MIPSDELLRFVACARDAWGMAAQGQAVDGYATLDLGLTWAETPAVNPVSGEESSPEPWAAELVALYQSELVLYLEEYGKELGKASLSRQVKLTRTDARQVTATARSVRERSEQLRQRAQQLTQRASEMRQASARSANDKLQ